MNANSSSSGILYIVSTPIGNLQDITIRAITTLFEVDIIVSENVSTASKLLFHVKNKYPNLVYPEKIADSDPNFAGQASQNDKEHASPKLMSMNEFEEESKIYEILHNLQNGKNVALISEAGTPLLSDPGFKLVREAQKKGVNVVTIPGVSSITAALSISGLPTDKFLFVGFPPKSSAHRKTFFTKLKTSAYNLESNDMSSTIIFFESPHRLVATLEIVEEIFGNIDIVVAHELTKIHESVTKKIISEHIAQFNKETPRGEFVVLLNIKQ